MEILIKKVRQQNHRVDVLVKDGRIEKIDKNIRKAVPKVIDGRGKAILPGFYNLHTHAAMTLLRGFAEDMELEPWLTKKIWPAEAKFSAQDIYWGTKLACLEMIKSGTVAFVDMYWHQEAAMQAAQETGVRAYVGLTGLDAHPFGSRETVEKKWQQLKNQRTSKIKLVLAPHALYTVSPENLRWAAQFARQQKLLIHFHLAETKKEVEGCVKRHGCRPVEFLEKLGFLGPNTILAHSIWLSDKEIKILAKRKCNLVYCPISNMKLSSGVMPLAKLQKAGLNICLGTDSVSSNNNLDMVEEMKLGAILQKLSHGQELKTKDIFTAATKNGASALRLKSGIIKRGQLADFILINTQRLDFLPGFDLIDDLVYSASSECVDTVVCGGEILMEARTIEGEQKLISEIKKRYGKNK